MEQDDKFQFMKKKIEIYSEDRGLWVNISYEVYRKMIIAK